MNSIRATTVCPDRAAQLGTQILLTALLLHFPRFSSAAQKTTATIQDSAPQPIELRCEYARNPLAVDTARPSLGWVLDARGHDKLQTAYQVLVATKPELLEPRKADLWDSGKVKSSESVHATYGGARLRPNLRCFWKVRIWDEDRRASVWSDIASWQMGLLSPEDWKAQWIGAGPANEPIGPAGFFKSTNELANPDQVKFDGRSLLLRKEFVATKPIRHARVHVTGLGYYELYCNGQKVGRNVLAPAKSNYRKWVLYDTYAMNSELQQGTNVLGIVLGNGWFNPYPKWWQPYRMQWFGSKRALMQLHLEYTDGSEEIIKTDESWETAPGPVLFSCVYDGEVYDAREERAGWNTTTNPREHWKPVTRMPPPGGKLISHQMPTIQIVEQIRPVGMKAPQPGVFVFDFGQNFAGWVRLKLSAPRGARVQLRHAEDARADGSLDTTSNEHALATDVYIAKGEGVEVYEPRFTFHGFRYLEVTGLTAAPELEDLAGCVIQTACAPTGSFSCDNELLNRIHRATVWSQRSNLIGYPMDCPQRDERLGWFGDAMVTMEQAMFNFDMPLFYRHWLNGIRLNQNETNGDISIISPRPYMAEEPDPTWSSAFLVMSWDYYQQYGDKQFLSGQYEAMKRYVDYLRTQATNCILPKYWIGDWGTVVKGWQEGEPESVGTGFYYLDSVLVAKAAAELGKPGEAREYQKMSEEIRRAYHQKFFDPVARQYDKGTQFSNAFPLWLGIAESRDKAALLNNILKDLLANQGHFTVGVLGAKYLIDALTEQGRADVAYELATKSGYPSWAHMLDGGRTTLSEFWDLHGSHNHVMMGSIDGWFYRVLAGIQPDEKQPGFEHFYVKPFFPDSLTNVSATVQTLRGQVVVRWLRNNGEMEVFVKVPVNSRATIILPTEPAAIRTVPKLRRQEKNSTTHFEVGSGEYELRFPTRRSQP